MEEQLSRILEKALRLAEQTGEFVMEQAPDLLREFYLWHTTKYSMAILLFLVLTIILYKLPYWVGEKGGELEQWDEISIIIKGYKLNGIFCAFSWLFSAIALGLMFQEIYHLTFILVAPKLYLIEYFIH